MADFTLYYDALAADEALSDTLAEVYGKRNATDMRYKPTRCHTHPAVLAAFERKHAADAAWLAEMRCGG